MIDYKCSDILGITPQEVFNNSLLDFLSPVSLKTGEILPSNNKNRNKVRTTRKQIASYQEQTISIVNDQYIKMEGSLHKYYNNGQNHSDFTLNDLFEVIMDIHSKLHFNPLKDEIRNVEFGVNVRLPFETRIFLDSIITYKGKEYEKRTFQSQGYMLKFFFDQYELKIYDKGLQYSLPYNLLRFEVKVRKMEFLRAKGISLRATFDLLKPEVYNRLGQLLNDCFSQLVVFDESINLRKLNQRDRNTLLLGQNPRHWTREKEGNPERYKKRLKRFNSLVSKHGKRNLKETVGNLISEKWDELTQTTEENVTKCNKFLSELTSETFPEITTFSEKNIPRNNTSKSMLLSGQILEGFAVRETVREQRLCISCGRDISSQKKGSRFCSERLFGKEVKQCRNKESNPRNHFKRRELKIKSKGLLFEIDSYLDTKRTIEKFNLKQCHLYKVNQVTPTVNP